MKRLRFHIVRAEILSILFVVVLGVSTYSKTSEAADYSVSSSSQALSLFSLSYVISTPTGSMADFLSNSVSYRGLGVEADLPLGHSDLFWGISARWLYFNNEQDNATVTSGNATATGRIFRSVDSLPMVLHLKYALLDESEKVIPYVGFGLGGIYGVTEFELGAISAHDYGWQFVAVPELGAIFKFSSSEDLKGLLNVRYDSGWGAGSTGTISNVSFALGLGAGF